ncbi:MAG: hypothetical protein ABFS45_27625, partial [Pseudomonadota bacterium]
TARINSPVNQGWSPIVRLSVQIGNMSVMLDTREPDLRVDLSIDCYAFSEIPFLAALLVAWRALV